jgi:hypothetical protein
MTSNSSTTSTSILPTAPTSVNGGGSAGPGGGAPYPGATGGGGGQVYGPPDGYISAVNALRRNVIVVSLVGCLVGGGLVMF